MTRPSPRVYAETADSPRLPLAARHDPRSRASRSSPVPAGGGCACLRSAAGRGGRGLLTDSSLGLRRAIAPLGRRLLSRRLPAGRTGGLALARAVTERHGRPTPIEKDATRLSRPRVAVRAAGGVRQPESRVARVPASPPEPAAAAPELAEDPSPAGRERGSREVAVQRRGAGRMDRTLADRAEASHAAVGAAAPVRGAQGEGAGCPGPGCGALPGCALAGLRAQGSAEAVDT